MKRINFAPLCGIFKRHSPSMHLILKMFCAEGFKTKPRFLCNHCTACLLPPRIRPLSIRKPPRRTQSIDEMDDYKADVVIVDETHPKKEENTDTVYLKAVRRMKRVGVTDHVAQITYLENEIDYYRERIRQLMEKEEGTIVDSLRIAHMEGVIKPNNSRAAMGMPPFEKAKEKPEEDNQ